MGSIKRFDNFSVNEAKLNEGGVSSMDSLGTVKINGVKLDTLYNSNVDSPDFVSYDILVNLTPELMVKIGIWSDEFVAKYGGEDMACIFSDSKTISQSQFKKLGFDSVGDMKDDDIAEVFSAKTDRLPDEYTAKDFIKAIKKHGSNGGYLTDINDWRVLTADQITEKKNELKDKKKMEEISKLLAGFTPKETLSIVKRRNMPEDKIAQLQKLTKKKGEELLQYIEDAIENSVHESIMKEFFAELMLDEKLSADAQEYVSKKIAKLKGEGKGTAQAAAIAYSYAKKKGYKIPNKKKTNESETALNLMKMTSLQFYKLIDLLEADIEAYDQDDIQYYEEMTGLDTGTLLDLYASYGYNVKKYNETKKLKDAYMKKTGKTWEKIQKEAEDAE